MAVVAPVGVGRTCSPWTRVYTLEAARASPFIMAASWPSTGVEAAFGDED